MNNLMGKGYDERYDLFYTHITHHSHCKASPHIHLLDHDNLQNFMFCTFHDKSTPTVTPLAPCQTALQRNLEKCVHDNLQMRPQLLHLKYENVKLDSFQVFQRKYHCVLQ